MNQVVHIVLLTENAFQLDIFSTTYFVFRVNSVIVKKVSDSACVAAQIRGCMPLYSYVDGQKSNRPNLKQENSTFDFNKVFKLLKNI